MVDVLFVLVAIGFFALCALYVRGCDRLVRADDSQESHQDALVSGGVR